MTLIVLGVLSLQAALAPDLVKINDGKTWSIINTEPSASVEEGKRVVRLFPIGGDGPGSNVAMALVGGLEFDEGTIEIDLRGSGRVQRSFLGVAFAVVDAKRFEAVYFRPFNFAPDDVTHRGRAVQYVAWPQHTWEELRANTPGVYEAPIDPVPDAARWFHARIEVAKQQVRVFVDGAKKPCLTVERLGTVAKGRVGLWVDSHEGSFANLKITRR
jgi:hypothetical protein